jgi:hypothetical protein
MATQNIKKCLSEKMFLRLHLDVHVYSDLSNGLQRHLKKKIMLAGTLARICLSEEDTYDKENGQVEATKKVLINFKKHINQKPGCLHDSLN